jgi:uncharacterized protein (DUF952 family)
VRIFHVAMGSDWEAARKQGSYTAGLGDAGFIQAAYPHRWAVAKERQFMEIYTPLMLLEIETDQLSSVLLEEQSRPGSEEICPRIYGPLNLDAVVGVTDISRPLEA